MMASASTRAGPVSPVVLIVRDRVPAAARVILLGAEIAAPVAAVYGAWSSGPGLAWLASARVEPWPGGAYTLAGAAGDGHVLAIEHGRLLSVLWAMPAAMTRIAPHATVLTLTFQPRGRATWLTLTHAGFGPGPEWDEGLLLHRLLWPRVLGRLKTVLERGTLPALEA